jgi:sucrose phosphorylase
MYVHSLLGSRGDRTGAERSGIPRRINREKLEARRLENELADPGNLRHGIFQGLRTLLQERARHGAFAPSSGQVIHELADSVFVVERISRVDGRRMWCGHNVSAHPVSIPHPDGVSTLSLAPYDVRWFEV